MLICLTGCCTETKKNTEDTIQTLSIINISMLKTFLSFYLFKQAELIRVAAFPLFSS